MAKLQFTSSEYFYLRFDLCHYRPGSVRFTTHIKRKLFPPNLENQLMVNVREFYLSGPVRINRLYGLTCKFNKPSASGAFCDDHRTARLKPCRVLALIFAKRYPSHTIFPKKRRVITNHQIAAKWHPRIFPHIVIRISSPEVIPNRRIINHGINLLR